MPDRRLQDGVRLPARLERLVGERRPRAGRIASPPNGALVDLEVGRQDEHARRASADDLRADAVARQQDDLHDRCRGGPVSGHALRRTAMHSSTLDDVGVLRLDVEEVRLVRRLGPVADALARDDRRPAVLEQVDRRRADAARRRRAAEDDRVDALGRRGSRRGSCRRSPRRPSSATTGSSSRGSRRGSISTQRPAELELGERGHLLHPEPAVLPMRLEADRRVDDRMALRPRRVEQPSRRLDLGVRSAPSRHSGSVKPQMKSIDEHAGRSPSVRLSGRAGLARRPRVPARRS